MRRLKEKTVVFLEMIKFEHSIFALPFAYMGLFLAERGWPNLSLFLWVTLAMVSFRTLGMSLNRIIDRNIDAKNPRTQDRALPSGKLSNSFTVGACGISLFLFLLSCSALNTLCLKLSIIPILLAFLYPWMKRFSWLCHFVLGLILGIAPYGAWIASQEALSWVPGFLTFGVSTWVAGFDIIYALADQDFDREEKLFSVPAQFGSKKALQLVSVLHGLSIVFWCLAGILAGLGAIYFLGMGIVAALLVRENWLIRSYGTAKIQEAFFKVNAMVSLLTFVALLFDLVT